MDDLKKLANMIRNNMADSNVLTAVADALDTYIKAQESAEPVAWHVRTGPDCPWYYSPTAEKPYGGKLWTEYRPLYAAPPPREPISREALRGYCHDIRLGFMDHDELAKALGIEVHK